jgi:hypothetical protein
MALEVAGPALNASDTSGVHYLDCAVSNGERSLLRLLFKKVPNPLTLQHTIVRH